MVWTMKDYNKGMDGFRPVDIYDDAGKHVVRISDGSNGVLNAAKIVRSINAMNKIIKIVK